MEWTLLWTGAGLGLSVAAPVGPIGLLCIRTTLERGRTAGLAVGLGAAVADFAYGLAAAFGLGGLAVSLAPSIGLMRWAGVVMLLYLSWTTFRSRPATDGTPVKTGTLSAFAGTFLLTITNPMTVLTFAALFAGLSGESASWRSGTLLAAGVLAGSAAWWLFLTVCADRLRHLAAPRLLWINRASAVVLAGFAVHLVRSGL